MADETTVKSFRVTEETATKFKEIAKTLGGNQQTALARLIDVYEMQGAKSALPPTIGGRLEDLSGHLTAISRIYTDMAESIALQDKTIRAQYTAQLDAKDRIIADMQERIANLQSVAQEAESKAQIAIQEAERKAQAAVQAAEQRAAEQIAEAQAKLAEANGAVLEQVKQLLAGTATEQPTPAKATKTVKQKQAKSVVHIKTAD